MSTMPGLRGMIQTIRKDEFHAFIQHNAPSVDGEIDWSASGEAYVDGAYGVLSDDVKTSHEVREQFFPHLYEIHLLSENPKEGTNYREKIFANSEAKAKWLEHFKFDVPDITTMATWMQVHANDVFQSALSSIMMSKKESNGGYWYFLPAAYEPNIAPRPFEEFKTELKSYLNHETGVKMHANVERLDLTKMIRFTVYTDPFPKNEQHFKETENDELDVRLSRKVDCFCISLPKAKANRQPHFRLKCDFLRAQRDVIARLFAEYVLHTTIHDKCQAQRDLNAFRTRPKKFDFSQIDGFESLRYQGMKVVRESGGKKPDTFSWRYGEDDFYDHAEIDQKMQSEINSLSEIQELYLSIRLQVGSPPQQQSFDGFADDRPAKTYEVTVRRNGDWSAQPTPLDCEVRKIDAVLEAMGLQDISGDKILRKVVRK